MLQKAHLSCLIRVYWQICNNYSILHSDASVNNISVRLTSKSGQHKTTHSQNEIPECYDNLTQMDTMKS